MRWLEVLGILPRGDSQALRLTDRDPWEVGETRDASAFYRALHHLITPTSVLYLEGSTEKEVPRFLEMIPAEHPRQVRIGTVFPSPDIYHIPATPRHLNALADLIDRWGIALPAIHTHLYDDLGMILEWHDAFTEPILVSSRVSEEQVRRFANAIGQSVTRAHAA
jgi:hypothetical protein